MRENIYYGCQQRVELWSLPFNLMITITSKELIYPKWSHPLFSMWDSSVFGLAFIQHRLVSSPGAEHRIEAFLIKLDSRHIQTVGNDTRKIFSSRSRFDRRKAISTLTSSWCVYAGFLMSQRAVVSVIITCVTGVVPVVNCVFTAVFWSLAAAPCSLLEEKLHCPASGIKIHVYTCGRNHLTQQEKAVHQDLLSISY